MEIEGEAIGGEQAFASVNEGAVVLTADVRG
jgi:hypothetical protein